MIQIDRLQLRLRATAAAERVPALERRLRDALTRELGAAVAHAFPDNAFGADGADDKAALVFIDRLEFHAAVNAAADDQALGRALARPLSARLTTLIDRGGEGVRRYPDRAAWIAEFLLELMNGSAWRRWWFDDLDGLRALPVGAALRTVILDEGDVGIAALATLAPAAVEALDGALGDLDATRVVRGWGLRAASIDVAVHVLWNAALTQHGKPRASLIPTAVALERSAPGSLGARNLAVLAGIVALRGAPGTSALGIDADRRDLESICSALRIDSHWLRHLDADERAALTARFMSSPDSESPQPSAAADSLPNSPANPPAWHGRTDHGGAFLLWAVQNWLRWPTVWRRIFASLPETANDADMLARAMSLVVIAHTLRPDATEAVTADGALRRVWCCGDTVVLLAAHWPSVRLALHASGAGLHQRGSPNGRPPQADPSPDARNAALLMPRFARASRSLLDALGRRVPGCAGASHAYLRANLLTVQAGIEWPADGSALDVTMTRAPLHVLLLLAGLDHGDSRIGETTLRLRTEDAR